MDSLTARKVKKFAENFGFEGSEAKNFERYIAATYLYKYLKDDIDSIEKSVLGGGNDEGIDIAAVIVNGQIVFEPSEIDSLIEDSPTNTSKIIFIQAKTGQSYDSKRISKFLHGINLVTKHAINLRKQDTLQKLPKLKNSRLKDLALLIDKIIENIEKFPTEKIPCDIYYITTSETKGADVKHETQIQDSLQRIKDHGLYVNDLDIKFHGKTDISVKRNERSGPQNIKFNFEKRQTIPDTDKINEAYIGLISAKDVINLLIDESGEIRSGIFTDNVRLDLGAKNSVNKKIMGTLNSNDRSYFPFYNNGLTIVASELKSTGDRFMISGYQIVNGGQTSHQLIRWFQKNKDMQDYEQSLSDLWIPVKIVSSQDASIRANVAVSTNLQTAIGATDIQGSSQIAKDVEEYFETTGPNGLRYERQSSGSGANFTKLRVISTRELNRAVASAIFGESSKAIGDPKELEIEGSFVWGDYPVEMYYYAAWIVYRIDRHLARNSNYSALKAAKYHIAMMVSCIVNPKFMHLFGTSSSNIGENLRKSKNNNSPNKVIDFNVENISKAIESAIESSSKMIQNEFKNILDQGRSLQKDDVRSRQHQQKLLDKIKSEYDK